MKKEHLQGYGRQIPPALNHVVIWFVQKGSSVSNARLFYQNYSLLKWRNRKGDLIRDWKVHAWNWLWNAKNQF